jgi:outer membrane protein, heavy metal efflux system
LKPIHRISHRQAAAALGCAAALLGVLPAAAGPVTLAQAVEAAWQRTQAGATALAQALRADAERKAAASYLAAPPALSLSQRSDRWQNNRGVQENEVGIALPLWLPGQRNARQAAAESEASVAAQSAQVARLRLAGQLRDLAWSLAGLKAEVANARAQQAYQQALAADVERRVKAGELARSDALAAQGESLAAGAELDAAEQRLGAERQRWTALTGLEADIDATEPAAPEADPLDQDRHPLLAQQSLAVEAARRQLEVSRRDAAEAPELNLAYRSERDARGQPSQGSMTLALRVPFGMAVRNEPLRAAAQGALDQALAEQTRTRLELAAELAIAREAQQAADRQTALQRERAALLRQRAALLDKSFRAGETALPELLLAVQAAAQADAALARHQAAQGNARARLLQASGLLP